MRRSMRPRVMLLILVVLATSAAGGAGQAATTGLSLEAHQTFRAAGIEPDRVLVQTGPLNYAGPSCPGSGWNCAPLGTPVYQTSTTSGGNVFDCSGTVDGVTCTVVQDSNGAPNEALCAVSSSLEAVTQRCSITQTNTSGMNSAVVQMTVGQSTGTTQASTQTATVQQTSGSGENEASITQSLNQTSDVAKNPRPAVQTQDAKQSVDLAQVSDSGPNDGSVSQSETQNAKAIVNGFATVTQRQNTLGTTPNVDAKVRQTSNSGDNALTVAQASNQRADGSTNSRDITQVQSQSAGGLNGDLDQNSSTGLSSYTADQNETQNLSAKTNPPGRIFQTQIGPVLCCLSPQVVGGKTPDTATLTQATTQNSTNPGVTRSNLGRATCEAKQANGCQTSSRLVRDGVTVAQSDCTDSSCDRTIDCTGEGGCQTVTRAPQSEVHKAVRDTSDEGSTFTGVESPNTVNAQPSDTIEYQLTYHNHGDALASHITVTDPVPDNSTFVSCSDSCATAGSTPGDLITWTFGSVEPGGTRVVTFQVQLDESFPGGTTAINNQATAHEASVVKDQSNITTVYVAVSITVSCAAMFVEGDLYAPTRITFDDQANGDYITTQYAAQGVTFDRVGEANPAISAADGNGRTTISSPNSLFNQNASPNPGSAGTPMTMRYSSGIARVGMYIGNDQTGPALDQPGSLTATLSIYDSNDLFLCSTTKTGFNNNVNTFIGIQASSSAIAKATIDYGNTTLAEEIDDLLFGQNPPLLT